MRDFGKRLKAAMRAAEVSGVTLATSVGVSKQSVTNWVHERNQPDLDQLFTICRALGVTADYLVLDVAHGLSLAALRMATGYERLRPEEQSQWEVEQVRILVRRPAGPRDFGDAAQQDEEVQWALPKTEQKPKGRPR